MYWTYFSQHQDGTKCMSLGYDTDGDKKEDTRFHYEVYLTQQGIMLPKLTAYGVDRNRNGFFEDDEWVPYIQEEENGGHDLQEPGNRRDVSY